MKVSEQRKSDALFFITRRMAKKHKDNYFPFLIGKLDGYFYRWFITWWRIPDTIAQTRSIDKSCDWVVRNFSRFRKFEIPGSHGLTTKELQLHFETMGVRYSNQAYITSPELHYNTLFPFMKDTPIGIVQVIYG